MTVLRMTAMLADRYKARLIICVRDMTGLSFARPIELVHRELVFLIVIFPVSAPREAASGWGRAG